MRYERHEEFDEFLNEVYASYKIGNLEYLPADILFELDPIAYTESYWDWKGYVEEDE